MKILKLSLMSFLMMLRAYDASRVEVVKVNDDSYEKYVYNVAAKTVGVRVQKAVDPEVAALLDDSDLSRFGSDDEDLELEEDFVIKANLPDGAVNVELDKNLSLPDKSDVDNVGSSDTAGNVQRNEAKFASFEEKPRACRLLDEQFDLYNERYVGGNERHESLAEKLNHAFKECAIDYNGPDDGELLEPAANVISRCRECAEKYENENPEEETALFEERSSDSEAAVKEERRKARRMKKETKELYKCEAQRAKKVAAFTGPSAIHLMCDIVLVVDTFKSSLSS
ncbi:hypothetical protein P3S67_011459 [Capsicum chacoense]